MFGGAEVQDQPGYAEGHNVDDASGDDDMPELGFISDYSEAEEAYAGAHEHNRTVYVGSDDDSIDEDT